MYKQFIPLLVILGFTTFLQAQTNDTAGISVHKSSRIDVILKKQFSGGSSTTVLKQTHLNTLYKVKRPGYRVMVLNTNDRVLAYKTKGQLLSRYSDQQVYMWYQSPFFKLKMGDFIDKSDAENLRKELSKTLTKGVFLIRETIIAVVKPNDDVKM